MVTKGRCEYIKYSIKCYIKQNYENKNMVLVSQGNKEQNDLIESYVKSIGRNDIYYISAPEDLNLGTMRNISVELSTGDFICQWDDDDLYHPERISTQYNVLRQDNNLVASAYCDFIKYYKTNATAYWCDWSGERIPTHQFLPGSIMFDKKVFGMFSSFYPQNGQQCYVEEDLNVLGKLLTKGDIGRVWSGWHYIYQYHGSNVYDLNHHNLTLDTSSGKKVLDVGSILERRSLIESTFDFVEIGEKVAFRSKENTAFIYKRKI